MRLDEGPKRIVRIILSGDWLVLVLERHTFCTLAGGRVHAHGLRHTYASELARERTPINVIRDALGHTSLAVTDRYLRDVAPMHVIDTIRARRWDGA